MHATSYLFFLSLDFLLSSSRFTALRRTCYSSLNTLQPCLSPGNCAHHPFCPESRARSCPLLSNLPLSCKSTVIPDSSDWIRLPIRISQRIYTVLFGNTTHGCYFSFVCVIVWSLTMFPLDCKLHEGRNCDDFCLPYNTQDLCSSSNV